MLPDEYDDKAKQSQRSRSPARVPRDRLEHSEPRKSASQFTLSICPLGEKISQIESWLTE